MPLIQESNQKMTSGFIATMKNQSLTQKNDKSYWTSAKTALAAGIISSLGLAYFTYKHYGQKDITTPLTALTNPIGTALKVLFVSIVAPSLYYCFKNNNYQKSSPNQNLNHSKEQIFLENSEEDSTQDSQDKYFNESLTLEDNEEFLLENSEEGSTQYSQDEYFDTIQRPINTVPSSHTQYSVRSFSSLKDLECFFDDTCKKFGNHKEITVDTVVAINTVLLYLKNNTVFESREKMIRNLIILVATLLTVQKNYEWAAYIVSNIYDKFLTIDENRAVDIATYCIHIKKFKDESKNNDLINTCAKIVERTKESEKLFISLAVKCSERADSSPAHDNVVIEFLDKYKEVGEAIVNYMIGCSKLDNSYAQEKIESLHMNEGISIPLLNSCINNLFGKNKSQPLVGNKSVIFDFFERRIHQIVCSEGLLPEIQKVIKSYKTAYTINEDDLFIKTLIDVVENDGQVYYSKIESNDALALLNLMFECYKELKDFENMKILFRNCFGNDTLTQLTSKIENFLNVFYTGGNTNQLEQKIYNLNLS